MKHFLILIIATLSLSACMKLTNEDGSWNAFTPRPLFLRNIPKGQDGFSQGFRDGCNDSLGLNGYGGLRFHEVTWGNSIAKPLIYEYNYDANRAMDDEQYSLGVGHGFSYCGVAANAVIGF